MERYPSASSGTHRMVCPRCSQYGHAAPGGENSAYVKTDRLEEHATVFCSTVFMKFCRPSGEGQWQPKRTVAAEGGAALGEGGAEAGRLNGTQRNNTNSRCSSVQASGLPALYYCLRHLQAPKHTSLTLPS